MPEGIILLGMYVPMHSRQGASVDFWCLATRPIEFADKALSQADGAHIRSYLDLLYDDPDHRDDNVARANA